MDCPTRAAREMKQIKEKKVLMTCNTAGRKSGAYSHWEGATPSSLVKVSCSDSRPVSGLLLAGLIGIRRF